jgi:hypothetical protein
MSEFAFDHREVSVVEVDLAVKLANTSNVVAKCPTVNRRSGTSQTRGSVIYRHRLRAIVLIVHSVPLGGEIP